MIKVPQPLLLWFLHYLECRFLEHGKFTFFLPSVAYRSSWVILQYPSKVSYNRCTRKESRPHAIGITSRATKRRLQVQWDLNWSLVLSVLNFVSTVFPVFVWLNLHLTTMYKKGIHRKNVCRKISRLWIETLTSARRKFIFPQTFFILQNWSMPKLSQFIRQLMKLNQAIIGQFHYFLCSIDCSEDCWRKASLCSLKRIKSFRNLDMVSEIIILPNMQF